MDESDEGSGFGSEASFYHVCQYSEIGREKQAVLNNHGRGAEPQRKLERRRRRRYVSRLFFLSSVFAHCVSLCLWHAPQETAVPLL